MISRLYFCKALFCLLLLFLSSCSGKSPDIVIVSPESAARACRVAVLPFVDEANDPGIAQLSSRVFRNQLVSAGGVVVDSEGSIRRFLTQEKLLASDLMDTHTGIYRELAERLDIDTVIRGKVIKSGIDKKGSDGSIPFIDLKVEMVDARTGQLLVDTFHQRRGDDYRKIMHIGMIRTKTGLMSRVAEEIIEDWKKEGVVNCQPLQ